MYTLTFHKVFNHKSEKVLNDWRALKNSFHRDYTRTLQQSHLPRVGKYQKTGEEDCKHAQVTCS